MEFINTQQSYNRMCRARGIVYSCGHLLSWTQYCSATPTIRGCANPRRDLILKNACCSENCCTRELGRATANVQLAQTQLSAAEETARRDNWAPHMLNPHKTTFRSMYMDLQDVRDTHRTCPGARDEGPHGPADVAPHGVRNSDGVWRWVWPQ